jgi:hypothetical protein
MSPTVKEFQKFKEDLGLARCKKGVLEVKVEATRLFKINAKLATEYLMYHRRNYQNATRRADDVSARQKK